MSKNIKADKDMEQKIWVKIPKKNGTWKGVNIGDELVGTYLKKLPDSFRGAPKTKYCFATKHPQAVDGKIIVYGTEGINNQLEDELIGCDIKITYQGTQPTADPKKRHLKYMILKFLWHPHILNSKNILKYGSEIEEPKSPVKLNLQMLMTEKLKILLKTMKIFTNQIIMEKNPNHRILSIWLNQIQT